MHSHEILSCTYKRELPVAVIQLCTLVLHFSFSSIFINVRSTSIGVTHQYVTPIYVDIHVR